MDFEIQNFIVYAVVAYILYLLLGQNIHWLYRKLFRQSSKSANDEYLNIYKKGCSDCNMVDLHYKATIRKK